MQVVEGNHGFRLLLNPRGRLNFGWQWVSLGGAKKRGILNNRKETLMATKKITEIILSNSLRLFCLKFRHIVQYPEPLKEKVIIKNGWMSIQF